MKFSFGQFTFKRHIIAFVLSLMITLTIAGLSAILLSFFSPPAWLLSIINIGIFYFSSALAAFFSSFGSEKNGFMTGAVCADIYGIILITSGIMFFGNTFNFNAYLKVLGITTLIGAIAGIIGINFKK